MYKRIPTQSLVAAFTDEQGAEKVLESVAKAAAKEEFPICTNAAIAVRNEKGRTTVKELGKPGMLKGLVGGGAVGGVAGAVVGGAALSILGPIGVAAGAVAGGAVGVPLGAVEGAIVGSIGKMTVDGMDKNKLKGVGGALEPGTSALVLVFAEVVVKKEDFEAELQEYKKGSDKITEAISSSISANLKQGNNCAHLLAVTEDGVVMERTVVGEYVFAVEGIVLAKDVAAAAEFTATPEGAAATAVVVTEDDIFVKGVVATNVAVDYEFEAEA
jgi:uncharacterized membrane protein